MENQDTTIRFYGERMREMRHARKMTANELGHICNLNVRHIYRLESNQRPHIWGTTIALVAHALDISADYLLGLSDTPNRVSSQKGEEELKERN
jgi:transcriptional regulator with XRE-family HTH domain